MTYLEASEPDHGPPFAVGDRVRLRCLVAGGAVMREHIDDYPVIEVAGTVAAVERGGADDGDDVLWLAEDPDTAYYSSQITAVEP